MYRTNGPNQQRHQQYQSWNSPSSHGAYAPQPNHHSKMTLQDYFLDSSRRTSFVPPYESPARVYSDDYNINYYNFSEDNMLQSPKRTPVAAYKHPAQRVYADDYNVNYNQVEENIDAESEEFINLEHKKFLRLNTSF